jgi:hypothetical protein
LQEQYPLSAILLAGHPLFNHIVDGFYLIDWVNKSFQELLFRKRTAAVGALKAYAHFVTLKNAVDYFEVWYR